MNVTWSNVASGNGSRSARAFTRPPMRPFLRAASLSMSALRAGDLARCGALVDASHASLRDDFEVSIPELDALADALRAQRGVYGARLVGAGFGGSVLALADAGRAADAARAAAERFRARSGRVGHVVMPV